MMDKDSAEDILQEVFIKLFTNKKPFNDAEHEKAWLMRVTINLCKNQLSSKASGETELNEEIAENSEAFESNSEQRLDIERILRKLSPEQRGCIYLYYYEGYKIREISEMLVMNINTVKSVLKRARQTLKINLDKENNDELL